jgi:hypothetical protein
LQVGFFFRQNGSLNGADLQANATVNAGGKIDPVPVSALGVFARAFVNTGDGAGINTVCDAFANVSHNGVGHNISSMV